MIKVYIYRYFSKKDFGNIYCFTENLNSKLLYIIYKKTLLPSARKFFREDDNNWKLQDDNDPKHTSGKAQNWKDENDIKRIFWSSQSLDLILWRMFRLFSRLILVIINQYLQRIL